MSLKVRVQDGTRPDVRLCDTCDYSHIILGPQQGQEVVFCHLGYDNKRALPFPVVRCSAYRAKGQMTEHEAKSIGWVLEVKAGKVVGFKPPTKEYQGVP